MNKGFSLALQGKSFPSFKQEDELYAGDTINLFFEFPNGKAIKLSVSLNSLNSKKNKILFILKFKQGQDVEWAKNVVQDRTGLNRSDFKLFFENKQMIEILSLSDIPNLKDGSKVQVVVNDNVEFNFDQIA